MANRHTIQELQELQSLPLDLKIRLTKQRIREWIRYYGDDGVYVSFSGGKDSTVLLDIVREEYPNVTAMFVDVPTQYPELGGFVKKFDNVDIVRPKMNFFEVCKKYGFPLISKEVSECVQGARKYLTSLLETETVLTDRQTDRIPYRYNYERITGTGNYRTKANIPSNVELCETAHKNALYGWGGAASHIQLRMRPYLWNDWTIQANCHLRGGHDNKYRKLRGIGEYSKRQDGTSKGWEQSAFGDNVRNAHERQEASDKGEYP